MLLVRDDDILVHSREFAGREFDRFKGAHELLCQAPGKLLHAPAILVSEIQDFPQCIEYVQTETIAGRMQPELHGYKHIDYASLSIDEVREHLQKCIEWYYSTFNMFPSKWSIPVRREHIKNELNCIIVLLICSFLTGILNLAPVLIAVVSF